MYFSMRSTGGNVYMCLVVAGLCCMGTVESRLVEAEAVIYSI